MIDIRDLSVQAGDTQILDNVSMQFEPGKNYCILGKNGSGKSTLSSVLMGHPSYEVTGGSIMISGQTPGSTPTESGVEANPSVRLEDMQDLLEMEPDERSRVGIFLSFQNIPEIK